MSRPDVGQQEAALRRHLGAVAASIHLLADDDVSLVISLGRRRRHRRRVTWGAVAAATLLAVGLGLAQGVQVRSALPPAGPSTSSVDTAKDDPRRVEINPLDPVDSAGQVVYSDELVTEPLRPNADVTGLISRAAAAAVIDQNDSGPDLASGDPEVALRVVTITTGNWPAAPTPGWVFVWRGSQTARHGRVGGASTAAPATRCVLVRVVDAENGQEWDHIKEVCVPR